MQSNVPSITEITQAGSFGLRLPKLPSNPFVGLRPFNSDEALLYFGRREQTIELLRQLHRTHFVALVGSSGCGKSSLVYAGLIPKLEAGFLVEERDQWLIARMKPGDDPLQNLAATLLPHSTAEITSLNASIRAGDFAALLESLTSALTQSDANLLLLIDQFEELFRFGLESGNPDNRAEAARFVELILALSEQRELPIYVVMTMRSDFIGDCDNFQGFPEVLNRSQYLVPRLTNKQLRQAIEGPIHLFDGQITPQLLDRVLNDVGDKSDQLPVMQHALMRTWEEWEKERQGDGENPQSATHNPQPLDVRHYEAIGTIIDALSRDANSAIDGMTVEELKLTERMFMALIEIGENNLFTRHPRFLDELCEITGAKKESVMQIVNIFNDNRRSILTINISQDEENPLIDISHESVIWLWKKLGEWIEAETRSFKVYLRLATAAKRKEMTKATLYSGKDLVEAIKWKKEHRPNAAWAFKYDRKLDLNFSQAIAFLEKSIAYAEIEIKKQENARRLKRGIWNLITPIITYSVLVVVSVAWALTSYARVGDPNINPAITPANENLLNWGLRVSTSMIYFMARDLLTLIIDIIQRWHSLSPWLRFVSMLLFVLLVTNLFYWLRERQRKSLANSQTAEDNLLSELSKLTSD